MFKSTSSSTSTGALTAASLNNPSRLTRHLLLRTFAASNSTCTSTSTSNGSQTRAYHHPRVVVANGYYPTAAAVAHTHHHHASRARLSSSPSSYPSTSTTTLASSHYRRHDCTQVRWSSHSPLGTTNTARKKTSLKTLATMYERNEPISMLTAHDFPSAHAADHAGIDIVLVGDSLAMVALGMEDTSEITLDDMILHCKSVARGAKNAFIVGDLSMGSYEISPEQALASAIRMVKEGRVHAVKLEGGMEMAPTIKKITTAGIPVLAHVGLTPQRQNSLGGFRVQGNTAAGALNVLADAMAVEEAGAFGVVVEAVPEQVAACITKKLRIPTIGIGAGNATSGQVLVQVDMSGNFPQGRFLPKFVKKFGDVWAENISAIQAYHREVKSREYPAKEHTYPMRQEELDKFEEVLQGKA